MRMILSKRKVRNLFSLIILLGLLLLTLLFSIFVNREIKTLYLTATVNQPPLKKQLSSNQITLFFVGDIMLDRGVKYMVGKYGKGDYRFPFLKIAEFLSKADILFGNLEGPISDKGVKVGSIYSFRADPKSIEGLKFAGFDILSVANNHVFDYGREAMEDSFLRLKETGIEIVGGGFNEREACDPLIKEVKGTKIAFLAFTNLGSHFWSAGKEKSGICWLEKEKMKEKIKEAKEKADIVIVSFHFGEEYSSKPTEFQISISREAIEEGADLIVGHHPHVVQEMENYKGSWIFYSLGNFVFDQKFSSKTMEGEIVKVLVENNKIKEVIPIKTKINNFFQPEILEFY